MQRRWGVGGRQAKPDPPAGNGGGDAWDAGELHLLLLPGALGSLLSKKFFTFPARENGSWETSTSQAYVISDFIYLLFLQIQDVT